MVVKMSVRVTNGFCEISTDFFFGEVNGIEVDNVYDMEVFHRAVQEIHDKKIEFYQSSDYDLSILKYCPTIRYIKISGEADLSVLYDMPQIEGISIGWLLGDNLHFDFTKIQNLKQLQVPYNKKNKSIFQLSDLLRLSLSEYNEKDLQKLSTFKNLQDLSIEFSTFNSMNGIEELSCLRKVTLDYCLRLKDISSLSKLRELKELYIIDCNKIEQVEKTLGELNALEKLALRKFETKGGSLQNLDFVKRMQSLQEMECSWRILEKSAKNKKYVANITFC